MRVKDYMATPVWVVERNEPIQRARNLMFKHDISRLPVMDKGKLVGIVTKYDISNRLAQAAPEWRRRPIDRIPVQLVMTENPITIYPDATLTQAAELMMENEIDGLPVEKDGELVGIITSRDLLKYFAQQNLDSKVGDLMAEGMVSVHRHHTIAHVVEQMNLHGVSRVLVYEDNMRPVGVITRSNLTFAGIFDSFDQPRMKSIKMTRKESTAGRKQYRYIKQVPLVAEDIMSSPIIAARVDDRAVDDAKVLVEKSICGMPVIENDSMVGFFSTREIVAEIGRW
ncbi:CBS domain-containing protein [Methanothrix sp.]|uniref:CBS domain-containing protein n=1 Tax=Methanothrix sp. TaxID=90426 RepID=UPI002C7413C4|nr:CBS domain-containing protein [Methanothrix sp.]HOK58228.1 CBS domain-containing protein [Methanothrix sp.]HOL43552.1 CBS domain-containing protein [Methanothrix sp.]HPO88573.1 CBS domain-containing protein [Methanothrix sp.]